MQELSLLENMSWRKSRRLPRDFVCLFQKKKQELTLNCCPAESKHLKGQLDPPVGDGNVFCTKGGQLDPPVGDGNVFCTKGGQLDPPVGDGNVFCTKGGQLDPPVGDGNVFCIKGGHLDPPVGDGNVFCTKGGQLDPIFLLTNCKNVKCEQIFVMSCLLLIAE